MEFRHDGFDVWVYRRRRASVEYLVLKASPEKAERWFGGHQFWQVPSDFVTGRDVVTAVREELAPFSLEAKSIWAGEHAYTIYNRRYGDIVHLAVFAAEVDADAITLGASHSGYHWCRSSEAEQLVSYRGLIDGLRSVRQFISEREPPLPELQLA